MRSTWLAFALIPYFAIAAVDAWMHERARIVPRIEQWIHGSLAVTLTVFLVFVFRGRNQLAIGSLALFAVLLAIDELRFHRGISRMERSIHVASWVALAGFVSAWYAIDRLPA